jgi:hypothetical protein
MPLTPESLKILILAICAVIFIVALIGTVAPAIPSTPLGLIPFLILQLSGLWSFKGWSIIPLILLVLLVIIMMVVDFFLPSILTKYFGGSKKAQWGSSLGIILGIFLTSFLGPFAVIIGPFIGATLGEKLAGSDWKSSAKVGLGSVVAFVTGTIGEVIVVLMQICFFIAICVYAYLH